MYCLFKASRKRHFRNNLTWCAVCLKRVKNSNTTWMVLLGAYHISERYDHFDTQVVTMWVLPIRHLTTWWIETKDPIIYHISISSWPNELFTHCNMLETIIDQTKLKYYLHTMTSMYLCPNRSPSIYDVHTKIYWFRNTSLVTNVNYDQDLFLMSYWFSWIDWSLFRHTNPTKLHTYLLIEILAVIRLSYWTWWLSNIGHQLRRWVF